jgi:hypothetical protein
VSIARGMKKWRAEDGEWGEDKCERRIEDGSGKRKTAERKDEWNLSDAKYAAWKKNRMI